jgi:hypothetical protein
MILGYASINKLKMGELLDEHQRSEQLKLLRDNDLLLTPEQRAVRAELDMTPEQRFARAAVRFIERLYAES